jgi:hypothetical protein
MLISEHPTPMTLPDIALELRGTQDFDATDAVDRAVRGLIGVGLVHRNGIFVVPSRAALRFRELEDR